MYFRFVLNDVETSVCKLAFVLEKDEENPDKWLICGVYPIDESGGVHAPDDIMSTVFESRSESVIPSLMIYEVSSLNVSNGVLTIVTDDDKFSLPLADNCTWARRNGLLEDETKETLSYEAFKEEVELMRGLLENYDYTPLGGLLSFSIEEGKVVEVSVGYTEIFDSAAIAEKLAREDAEKEQVIQTAQNEEGVQGDAINAYLAMDVGDLYGAALVNISASEIPLLLCICNDDMSISVYHYKNGEVEQLLVNQWAGWPAFLINGGTNIVCIEDGGSDWSRQSYYEYRDGAFQLLIELESDKDLGTYQDSMGKQYSAEEFYGVVEEYQCEYVSGSGSIEDAVAAYQSQN